MGERVSLCHEMRRGRETPRPTTMCYVATSSVQKIERGQRMHVAHRVEIVEQDVLVGSAEIVGCETTDDGRQSALTIKARVRRAESSGDVPRALHRSRHCSDDHI